MKAPHSCSKRSMRLLPLTMFSFGHAHDVFSSEAGTADLREPRLRRAGVDSTALIRFASTRGRSVIVSPPCRTRKKKNDP